MAAGGHCDGCGKKYYRCFKSHDWPIRNEGSRFGWVRVEISLCLNCHTKKDSTRSFAASHIRVSAKGNVIPLAILAERRRRQRDGTNG